MDEQEHNRRIADAICAQFSWNGQMFKEGEYVAVLDGKIVAKADNPDDVISVLRALDRDPKRGMVIEVSHPTVDVIR